MKLKSILSGVLCAVLAGNLLTVPVVAEGEASGVSDNPFAYTDAVRDTRLSDISGSYKGESMKTDSSARILQSASGEGGCIVKFNQDTSFEEIKALLDGYSYEVIGNSALKLFSIKGVPCERLQAAFNGKYEYIEKDSVVRTQAVTTDPLLSDQWALDAVNIPEAWAVSKGTSDVMVAVIDTGVYRDHEDFAGTDIRNGHDYVYNNYVKDDWLGHGTETTGVIAATVNNGIGVAGVCWNVVIVPFQIFSGITGTADISDECSALYDAADAGVDVINLSIGASDYSASEEDAIRYAASKGCIIVAAAGNEGASGLSYPASYAGVISAGSVNSSLTKSTFSNYNSAVDVCAPGENVLTTCDPYYDGNSYAYVDGTSFSSPYVAGVAALVRAYNDNIDTYRFQKLLEMTCTDLGTAGYDTSYGYGLVDAGALLQCIQAGGEDGFIVSDGMLKGYYGLGGNITIPDTVTTIADKVFLGCTSLTGVTIPDSVKIIGESAFTNCASLNSITILGNLTRIGWGAFTGTGFYNNENRWESGVLYIGKHLIRADWVYIANSYKIKEGTVCIAEGAFYNCDTITDITIPNSLLSVGAVAFRACDGLKSIVIPKGVTYIGHNAFSDCTALTAATLPSDSTLFESDLFDRTTGLKTVTIADFTYSAEGGLAEDVTGYSAWDNFSFNKLSAKYIDDVYILNPYVQLTDSLSLFVKIHGYSDSTAAQYASDKYTFITMPKAVSVIKNTLPTKTTYTVGDTLNTSGLTLTVTYDDNTTETVTSGFICSPTTLNAVGTQTVNITYKGMTVSFDVTVSAVVIVSGITVKTPPTKTSYYVGDTLNTAGLTLTVAYSDNTQKIISNGFTCSPTKLATVGTQAITVSYGGKSATFSVTVNNVIKVDGVKLNIKSANIYIGATKQLTATVTPSNATNKAVTWSSGNTSVATVSSSGLVTAKAVGKATITCKVKDGSGQTAACTVTVIPKTPTGVKAASASYNSIRISWSAVSGATGYAVYRSATKDGTYTYLKGTTATSVTDISLKTGASYYYKVRAYKTIGDTKYYSGYSAIVYAKAATPTPVSVKAVSASYNSIKVSWTAVSGATGYAVYRASSKTGTYSYLKGTTSTSFTDTSRTAGKTYYYKVKAYKTIGNTKYYSGYSAIVSAKPVPAVPGSFTAVKASSTSVKTSWKAVSGATGYTVYRATSSGGTYTAVKTTTSTSYTNTGLTKNKTYYYKVRAYRTVNGTRVYGQYTSVKSAKPY